MNVPAIGHSETKKKNLLTQSNVRRFFTISKMTKDTIPYLPSIVQTETQQFLQLEIALIILRQLHAIIIAGMNE